MRIVADGDLTPSDGRHNEDDIFPELVKPDLRALENPFVKVFACKTTFERALTWTSTLTMFASAATALGADKVAERLLAANETPKGSLKPADMKHLQAAATLVLRTAKRYGKARFAQLAARYVQGVKWVPRVYSGCRRLAERAMIVNEAQEASVECDDHVCLVSCPGSGKTRTVVAKVLWCLQQVRDTTRRIGCITYTNAAVNEIETRLRQSGGTDDDIYYEICTIHSFCLNHIMRPHHYRLPEFRAGFEVVTPEDERWQQLVRSLVRKYRLESRTADSFERIRRDTSGVLISPSDIPMAAASEFVRFFDQNGFISFEDMVYQSSRLVNKHSFIARCLASRFAWLLIDEFQDTSAAQVAIFQAISDYGRTKFFLVGDPNQSIMTFAGRIAG